MMKFPKKTLIALSAGAIALGGLINFQLFTKHYFIERQNINEQLNEIELAEKKLDTTVLRSGIFLYVNQDDIIRQIDTIHTMLHALETSEHVRESHPQMTRALAQYRKSFDRKADYIYDFQTANATIKNATMVLPVLKQHSLSLFNTANPHERRFLENLSQTANSVLLSKNSLDGEMLNTLELRIGELEAYTFDDPAKDNLNTAVIENLKVFRDFFPRYKSAIENLESSSTQNALDNARKYFYREDQSELMAVKSFSYLLVALYMSSLGLIIYFLIRSEKDVVTDRLTGIGNRKGFERRTRTLNEPILILVNINKFKNYNDFYGVASGDRILIETANRLKQITQGYRGATLYRLGGDEFGILMERSSGIHYEQIGRIITEEFHKEPVAINSNIETTLSISIAVSMHKPLLETADMALKSIKNDRTRNLIRYEEGMNLYDGIKTNIEKTHELFEAIKNDRLIPYFQPIVSLQTSEVAKYEVLGRLVTQNGTVHSIGHYLDVVKESKLYPTLTRRMIQKSFAIMHDTSYEFSINLSIEDIADSETVAMIKREFGRYPQIASRVVFEILESEAVNDYGKISDFIDEMKRYGCKIAVDDFGSGYSNFAHILNLDIDIIKLDSSLIRDLNKNHNAIMIIETIIGFALRANIRTVAEYVSEKEVFELLQNLGVDYAQGYYIGKPGPFEPHNGPFCILSGEECPESA